MASSLFALLAQSLWEKPATMLLDTQASCPLSAPLEAGPPAPVELSDDGSPDWCVDCRFMRDPEPDPPGYAAAEFLPHSNCEMTSRWLLLQVTEVSG